MPDALPIGTVTFLFTDVEGSTKLLDGLGAEGYAQALERHRDVIRSALAEHGGAEVDTQGDAFFCAFASARDAVACAQSVRAGLEATPIRVRMGLHTGEAVVSGDGYVGLEVHRAARIGACGHGGQIVVSPTTAALLEPDGLPLSDLGEHRLKDLTAPVRLYQLGDGDFPPLKTLYRTNLPVPATPFLGRERELAELVELATRPDTRLLTLTGPGGTGKTRLALQLAGELAERFPDGTFWAPLAGLRNADLVPSAIAEALGVAEEPGVPLEDTIARETADRRILLLVDNCEHVLEGIPRVLPKLVTSGVFGIATSRERLALGVERVYPVAPLDRADSIALFTGRAEATGGVLEPTAENQDAIDALCARLDDLPLALELAAARAALLPPSVLLERLSARFDLLAGPRDAEERQRTLRATIAWSHDLLDPAEQAVFRRLAVFVGGATLEAVESVCGADLEQVLSLVSKSLVRQRTTDHGHRFWMLETVREFASDELEASGEGDSVRDGHLEWFFGQTRQGAELLEAGRISDMHGIAVRARLGEVERDIDNLRAAFAWARDRERADAVLGLAAALRMFYVVRGRFGEAEDVIGTALPYARDAISVAMLRSWLAQALRGHTEQAWTIHLEAERALEEHPDRSDPRWMSAWLDVKLAQAHRHYWANDHAALAATAKGLEADLEAHGSPAQRIDYLSVLLQETYRRDRYVFSAERDALADAFYRASVEAGDWYAEFQRGFYLLWRGKLDDALAHFDQGANVARELGDALMEVRCLVYRATARRKQNDVERTRLILAELGELDEVYGYGGLYAAMGAWVAWREGRPDDVERLAAQAFADWERSGQAGPGVFQWTARFPMIGVELARGDADAALEQARWLVGDSQQPLPPELDGLVRDALAQRDPEPLERALELGREHGYS